MYPRMIRSALCLIAVSAIAGSALAHSPVFSCMNDEKNDKKILCEGGFSDGSSAKGVEIQVMSYEDEVLNSAQLDDNSEVTFDRPEQDFYIRFNGGSGHEVEVDQSEIL